MSKHSTRATTAWVLVALVLSSLTTRSVVTVMSAALPLIPDAVAPAPWAAILPALPLPAFAIASLVATKLTRRAGMPATLTISATTIAVAEFARASDSLALLLIGSAVALLGAAIQLAVMPGLIYAYFPRSFGLVTGVFVAAMALTSAAASGSLVPLADATGGWRGALAVWSFPAALAAIAWLVVGVTRRAFDAEGTAMRLPRTTPRAVVVMLSLLFGCQAAIAFAVMGWLPTILISQHHSASIASLALGALLTVGLPATLVFSARAQSAKTALAPVLLSALTLCGLLVLPVARAEPALVLSVLLLGIGSAIYPVVLVVVSRSAASGDLVRTSAVVQGVGYGLAAPVPFVLGAVADAAGWTVAITLLCPIVIAQGVLSLAAYRVARNSPSALRQDAESPRGIADEY